MKYIWHTALLAVLCNCLYGAPPVSGGFMSGADSAVYVFWFHPGVYAYEQGIDGEIDELNLAPGDAVGEYAVVQKASFPFMSYIIDYSVKIHQGDIFPELPGDQFSRFDYSVYHDGIDSLPMQPADFRSQNSLCGGIPCGEQWAENRIDRCNLDGTDKWFALEWADSTPAAPQIKCAIVPNAEQRNKFGLKSGEYYSWSGIMYFPMFRYRFLTPFPIDTTVAMGWRRSEVTDNRPDSFLIRCYETIYGTLLSSYNVGIDTLCMQLPVRNADSVEVSAYYGDHPDDSSLAIRFNVEALPSIAADIEFNKCFSAPYTFNLVIRNTSPSLMEVTIGYDDHLLGGGTRELSIDGYGDSVVPFEAYLTESDSVELLITIHHKDGLGYPFLAKAMFPPQQPTDIERDDDIIVRGGLELKAHPNPCKNRVVIYSPTLVRDAKIEIYNVIGQKVSEWQLFPGHEIVWDGRDMFGQKVPSGVYLVRMIADGGNVFSRKLMLLQ